MIRTLNQKCVIIILSILFILSLNTDISADRYDPRKEPPVDKDGIIEKVSGMSFAGSIEFAQKLAGRNRYRAAVFVLEYSAGRFPEDAANSAVYYDLLGRYYLMIGRTDMAKSSLERAFDLNYRNKGENTEQPIAWQKDFYFLSRLEEAAIFQDSLRSDAVDFARKFLSDHHNAPESYRDKAQRLIDLYSVLDEEISVKRERKILVRNFLDRLESVLTENETLELNNLLKKYSNDDEYIELLQKRFSSLCTGKNLEDIRIKISSFYCYESDCTACCDILGRSRDDDIYRSLLGNDKYMEINFRFKGKNFEIIRLPQ